MFQLDDKLLQELGLGSLPPAEKNKMLAHIYETLELRVGMRLAEQMSDQQLDEFEGFIDGNLDHARNYLNTNSPGWEQGQDFQTQKSQAEAQGATAEAIIPEFAALKWLEKNFPDYKKVVAEELEKLKGEIKQQAPTIMQATMAAVGQPAPAMPATSDPAAAAPPPQPAPTQDPMQAQPMTPPPVPANPAPNFSAQPPMDTPQPIPQQPQTYAPPTPSGNDQSAGV
jgi:hypothetical protein